MTRPAVEESGKRYGRLVVLRRSGANPKRQATWLCRCDCGNEKVVTGCNLRKGCVVSCGCFYEKHGMRAGTRTPTYKTWNAMRQRCSEKAGKNSARYAERGIEVCEEWKSFSKFLADMGERPPGTTLDRKDNNLGYCKENCRWATRSQQQRNRGDSIRLTWGGETLSIHDWAEKTKIPIGKVKNRLRRGWPIDRILTTP